MMQSLPESKSSAKYPWSVLHVIANHERQVVQHLIARSIDCYLPLYTETSSRKDRKLILERPLFTGYVFVRFAPAKRNIVLSVPSILHLLGDGQHEMVSAEEIDRIRKALAGGCALRPHPNVAVGTRVRVREGFFTGTEGIVTKFCKQCKVVMMLTAIEQRFSAEVNLDQLEILS